MTTKILSIMPPDGWHALYACRQDDDNVELFTEPLISWALVHREYEGDEVVREMDGMVRAYGPCSTHITTAGDAFGEDTVFVGFLSPVDLIEDYRGKAERSLRMREELEEQRQRLQEAGFERDYFHKHERYRDPDSTHLLDRFAALDRLEQRAV